MNRRPIAVLLVRVVIAACNHGVTRRSIEEQLGRAITDRCPDTRCVIKLREVTPFDWDKMVYFDYVVSLSVRRSVVRVTFETEELRR